MAVLHIAFKRIKDMLFNPIMLMVLVGLPLFQMFIMKTILGDTDTAGNAAESFVDITFVGLDISLVNLNAASTLVQFLLITGMIGASMFIQEREKNILVRVFSLPVSKNGIILGNAAGQVVVTSCIGAVVIALSKVALGVEWGNSWFSVLVLTVAVIYVSTALGFAFSGFFKSFKVANGAMVFFVMLMTFMSGGFSFDGQFETIGKLTINKWAFNAYARLMDGQSLGSIAPNILILMAMGTGLLILAFVVYGRENLYE